MDAREYRSTWECGARPARSLRDRSRRSDGGRQAGQAGTAGPDSPHRRTASGGADALLQGGKGRVV